MHKVKCATTEIMRACSYKLSQVTWVMLFAVNQILRRAIAHLQMRNIFAVNHHMTQIQTVNLLVFLAQKKETIKCLLFVQWSTKELVVSVMRIKLRLKFMPQNKRKLFTLKKWDMFREIKTNVNMISVIMK